MTDYIHRKQRKRYLEASKYFSVIAVSGPRQSGKSTLLTQLFPLYEKYSLRISTFLITQRMIPQPSLIRQMKECLLTRYKGVLNYQTTYKALQITIPRDILHCQEVRIFEVMKNLSESLAGRAGVVRTVANVHTGGYRKG